MAVSGGWALRESRGCQCERSAMRVLLLRCCGAEHGRGGGAGAP